MSKDDEPGQPKNAIVEMVKKDLGLEYQFNSETRTLKVQVKGSVLNMPCFQVPKSERDGKTRERELPQLTVDLTFSESGAEFNQKAPSRSGRGDTKLEKKPPTGRSAQDVDRSVGSEASKMRPLSNKSFRCTSKNTKVVFTYYNTKLRKSDMDSLEPGCWISDKIMAFYTEYLSR